MSPKLFDVIICGNSLSATVAALSAAEQQLSVAWLHDVDTAKAANIEGFDSLAPEGVHFLQHLLTKDEIEKVSLGIFDGVHRNGQFDAFDPLIGHGYQIDTAALKQLLYTKANRKLNCIIGSAQSYQEEDKHIIVNASNESYCCRWLIDAGGEHSLLSKQPVEYLSGNLWIHREYLPSTEECNLVQFDQTEQGWQWLAYDASGNLSKTYWHKDGENSQAYNSRWYRRQYCVEGVDDVSRVLLTAPTCYRFDPASGLGMSLQIKSAMLAVRAISRAHSGDHYGINQYAQQMHSTFHEIFIHLKQFYRSYELSVDDILA